MNVKLPNTAGLPETNRVARDVERMLARHPDIVHYTTNVGKGQPSIYYNVPQRNEQPNFAQIFVQCRAETWEEKNALVQHLRRELAAYPAARTEVKDFEQGRPLEQAIEEAGETRFIPILLTTCTAIGGLIPLILEPAPLYTPLAWVLIGGLLSSLLLSRIVTPVLYKLFPPEALVAPEPTLATA